jgi:hypothetical protein
MTNAGIVFVAYMPMQAKVTHSLAFSGCLMNVNCTYFLGLPAREIGSLQNLHLQHQKINTENMHAPSAI